MTSTARKKGLERFFLERFFEASGLSAGIVKVRENPDFGVRFEGRVVGLEVTQLFVSHDDDTVLPQAQESISDRILLRAWQLYDASGSLPAHVSVCFAPKVEWRQIDRDDTAEKLAAMVKDMSLAEWKRIDWHPRHTDQLAGVISFVHALGVPEREMAHWATVRSGWVVPVTVGALQARVDEKAKQLPEYRKAYEENWLLIYADGMRPSQLFQVGADFEPTGVVSAFNRTYFYAHPERVFAELGRATEHHGIPLKT